MLHVRVRVRVRATYVVDMLAFMCMRMRMCMCMCMCMLHVHVRVRVRVQVSATYVVDMLAFDSARAPALHAALGGCVRRLMRAEPPKLGFAISDDLARLESALPGATDGAASLYDLQRPATAALGLPRRTPVGLATACAALLRVPLDKTEQVRPSRRRGRGGGGCTARRLSEMHHAWRARASASCPRGTVGACTCARGDRLWR